MFHHTHLLRWTVVLVLALAAVLVVRSQANAEIKSASPARKQASTWSGAGGCARCQFSEITKAEDCAPVLKSGSNVFFLKSSERHEGEVERSLALLVCADVIQRLEVEAGFKADESGRKWLKVEQVKSMAPWESKSVCPVMQKTDKACPKELTTCQEKPMTKLDLEAWGRSFWQEVKDYFANKADPLLKKHFAE